MRNFTSLLIIGFLACMGSLVQAQTLNNPKDSAGYYIVRWDCAKSAFATSNNLEADETFTFAVDVSGTPWENWLKATPTASGATRSLAINKWTNFGDVSGGTNRLKKITGNIYGATWNVIQMATTMNVTKATGIDSVVYIYGQVFGFEFTATNPGANWWMWPAEIPAATAIDPGTGAIFKFLPYTGKKTSPEVYSDDYEGGLFFSNNTPEKGYTLPCAVVTSVKIIEKSDSPVVRSDYYNIQGAKLSREPQTGVYIRRDLKADGTVESTKMVRVMK